jgi:hypothetical protein
MEHGDPGQEANPAGGSLSPVPVFFKFTEVEVGE